MTGSSIAVSWISVGGITMLQSMKSLMALVRSFSVCAKKASRQNTCPDQTQHFSKVPMRFARSLPWIYVFQRWCLTLLPSHPLEHPWHVHTRWSLFHSGRDPQRQTRSGRGQDSPELTPSPQSRSVGQKQLLVFPGSPRHLWKEQHLAIFGYIIDKRTAVLKWLKYTWQNNWGL